MNKISKIATLLSNILYFLILFIIPLFFGFFIETNNVFELNKEILFNLLVSVLLFTLLIRSFYRYNNFNDLKTKVKNLFGDVISNKLLLFSFFVLFLSLIVSTFFSINKNISFFGGYYLRFGLLNYLFYFTFFVASLCILNNAKKIKIALVITALSSSLVSLYGILQANGVDFFNWSESVRYRVISSIGQPNLLAGYLALIIPLLIYLFTSTKNSFLKLIYLVILVTQFACLIYTYSMGGWFSLLFGFIITVIVYLFFSKLNQFLNKKTFIISGLLILIVIAIFFSGIFNSYLIKTKFSSVTDINSGSFASRVDFWRASIKGIKERPIFGHGLNSGQDVLVKYYDPGWAIHSNVNVMPKSAHNVILDILLTRGIFGFLAWSFFVCVFLMMIYKNLKRKKQIQLNYAILFSLFSFLAFLMLNYSFVVGELYFWFLLSLVFLISRNVPEKEEVENKSDSRSFLYIFSSTALVILIVFPLYKVIKLKINTIIADQYYRDIRVSYKTDEFFKANVLFGYIDELEMEKSFYSIKYALMLSDWLPDMEKFGRAFKGASKEYVYDALKYLNGNSYATIFSKARIYSVIASQYDPSYFKKAEEAYHNAITLSPNIPQNYSALASMYYSQEEYDLAIENYKKTNALLPDIDNEYLNDNHRAVILRNKSGNLMGIANSLRSKGDLDKAEEAYNEVLKLIPGHPYAYNQLAKLSEERGDLLGAIKYNDLAIESSFSNYLWHYDNALLYEKLGNVEKALEYANQASILNRQYMILSELVEKYREILGSNK